MSSGSRGKVSLCRGMLDLVSEQITLPEDAKEVIFHEFVGHLGLRGFFGDTLDDALLDIHENNSLVKKVCGGMEGIP